MVAIDASALLRPIIRPATSTDIPALVAQTAEIEGGDARDAEWFLSRLDTVLVLVDGDRVLGHTAWSIDPRGWTWWDQTVVAAEVRGQGWGGRLMEARDTQTSGLILGACREDNIPMVRLLTRLGFHICQRIPNGYTTGEALLWARRHAWER